MKLAEEYKTLYEKILAEHRAVFERQSIDQLQDFIDVISNTKKIFVIGVGREGIAAKAFAAIPSRPTPMTKIFFVLEITSIKSCN